MWINWKRFTCGAFLLASLALLLSGCGDLGGSQTTQGVAAMKTISGIVSDPDTGLPMANVKVQAFAIGADGTEGSTPLSNPASATSDPRGRYVLRIPADYTGSVMVVGDVSSGSVIRTLARMLDLTAARKIKAAVPQGVIASSTVPPVMLSFATNTVVEFVKQNSAAAFSQDNIRKATAALETFFGPNFTQTPPPAGATDTSTSKAQQDLIVSIRAINSVLSSNSSTSIATIVTSLVSSTGLGTLADSIKSGINTAATTLAAEGTLPVEYQPSAAINTAISNVQSAPVVIPALTDTVAPTAPGNLQGSALAAKKVLLTWSASTDGGAGSTGVTGYLVCRSESSDIYAPIDTVPAAGQSSFIYYDLSAKEQSHYSYKVIAFDAAQNLSEGSAPVAVTTPATVDSTPPSVPTGLVSRGISTSEVALQWQQSAKRLGDNSLVPAASYNVYRDYQLIATVTETFYTDKTAAAGTAYTYFVKAADADANLSAASQLLSVRTTQPAGAAPQAPGALSLASAAAYNKVALQWGASASAGVTYDVYRDGALIGSGITGTTYSDAAVAPKSTYAYTVKAAAGVLESAASNALSVTTPGDPSQTSSTAPAVPKNLTATVGSNSVSLSWTAGDTVAVGYDVLRSDDSGAHYAKIGTVKTPGYTDSTVLPNTSTYVYLVVAYSAAGARSQATVVGPVTTPAAPDLADTTPPTAPTALTGAADSTSGAVSLSWGASTKSTGDKVVAGYLVYRNGVQLAQVTSGTSFTDSSVTAGTSYSYSVKAFDHPGNVSAASNAITVATPAAAPNTYAIAGRITLNGTGLAGMMVTLSGGSAPASVVTDGSGNYLFSGVPNGNYTVTAVTSGNILFTPASRSVSVSDLRVNGQDFAAVLSGAVTGGVTYPEGTIIGGITYPTGVLIGGVYYPTATVIGGVTYPTGTVIGGTVFPSGVVIGGVSYPAGTVVGGIAFPVGAITTGYSWPTGTVIGGVVYPTGTVGGTVTFPTGTVSGTATYPTGVVVGGGVYPAGVVTATVTFPTGSTVGVILYPTGSATGALGYPTGSASGALSYPTGVVGAGVVYPTGSVSVGTTYPSGGLTGSLSYPSGSMAALLSW